ncbi:Chitobiase/beta-hexosaminidase C-terminal domain-containing protein [Maribacter sedimenticola]|uniref:Chitobiase/beta-hexosaminidase C-terminal domain-containing protein n=1 Tax=Maribacter sedimenticola TaxID=228956 RepID=A0ABY1SDS1_9FLAO|nr:chitobiase/beta-hexosaminidase C-terminal domain-containing protein [Maribacter sedimenticola]SNR27821.1 Chitobiase/beta-hexosaminidase C-terminal domain-containing protein [Maribacter sedimenticola]
MRVTLLVLLFAVINNACVSPDNAHAPTDQFVLSSPQIQTTHVLFDSVTTVSLNFDFTGAIIKYSLDGNPVKRNSKVYDEPLQIKNNTTINAKVYHKDYQESDQVHLQVVKVNRNNKIEQIDLDPKPNEKYPGSGVKGLIDFKKGSGHFSNDPQWMGFQTDSIKVSMKFKDNIEVSALVLSTLTDQASWIFAPARLAVYHKNKLVGNMFFPKSNLPGNEGTTFLNVPVKKETYRELSLVIYGLPQIPEWHQGKGTTPWFFMDEIIIQ